MNILNKIKYKITKKDKRKVKLNQMELRGSTRNGVFEKKWIYNNFNIINKTKTRITRRLKGV